MITWELIAALAVYNFIMYVTPGPNNSILTASGIKFGFWFNLSVDFPNFSLNNRIACKNDPGPSA